MLKNLLERNKKIVISLDYDLEEERLSEKLAFECLPFSKADATQDKAGKNHSANSKYPLEFDSYFRGYATSVNMESNLPNGLKLISLNFVEEQIMLLEHIHRKLTPSFSASEVKDHIMLRSLIPPGSGTMSPFICVFGGLRRLDYPARSAQGRAAWLFHHSVLSRWYTAPRSASNRQQIANIATAYADAEPHGFLIDSDRAPPAPAQPAVDEKRW